MFLKHLDPEIQLKIFTDHFVVDMPIQKKQRCGFKM